MRSVAVTYDDGEARAALTVRASTTLIGTRRTILHQAALAEAVDEPAVAILRRYTYPDYLAATEGTLTVGERTYTLESARDSLPFEAFLALPEALTIQWGNAVYDLNGHWLPVTEDESKKEAATSTSASSA